MREYKEIYADREIKGNLTPRIKGMRRFLSYGFLMLVFLVFSQLFPQQALATQTGIDYFFEQGNTAYKAGNYQEALQWYQKILDQGFESGQLYYNMGNCYYKMNKIGQAILFYEKARRLKPDDPDLKFNLDLANSRIIDRIELPPRFFLFEYWDQVKSYFTIGQLSYLVLTLYLLTMGLLIIRLFIRRYRWVRWLNSLAVIMGILTLFWGYIMFSRYEESRKYREAVVLNPAVTVRSAPSENQTEVFVIHEGLKVKLVDREGEWVKIILPDGKSGWMPQKALGVI